MLGGAYPGSSAPGVTLPVGSSPERVGATVPALAAYYFGQVGGLPSLGVRALTQAQTPTLAAANTDTLTVAQTQTGSRVAGVRRTVPRSQTQAVTRTAGYGKLRTYARTQAHAVTLRTGDQRAASATQGTTVTLRRLAPRAVTLTHSQGSVMRRGLAETLAATQAQGLLVARARLRTNTPAQSQAAAVTRRISRAFKLTQAQAAQLAAAGARILAATQGQALTFAHTAPTGSRARPAGLTVPTFGGFYLGEIGGLPNPGIMPLAGQQLTVRAVPARTFTATQAQHASRGKTRARTISSAQPQAAARTARIPVTYTVLASAAVLAVLGRGRSREWMLTQAQSTGRIAPPRTRAATQTTALTRTLTITTARPLTQPQASAVHRAIRTLQIAATQDQTLPAGPSPIRRVFALAAGQTPASAGAPASTFALAAGQAASLTGALAAVPLSVTQTQRTWPIGPVPVITQSDRAVTLALIGDTATRAPTSDEAWRGLTVPP